MIFYQNRDRQYEKPCSGYPNKEEKTYKPFVVPQKTRNIISRHSNPTTSPNFQKIRFLLVLSKSGKSMRKFRPNLLNDSLVLTIIITELFRSHSFFFLKIRLKLDRLLKPQSYPISAIDKEESTKAREAAPKRISVRKSIKLLEVCCLIKRQNEASLIFTILATSARRITSENENEHNPAPCSTSR